MSVPSESNLLRAYPPSALRRPLFTFALWSALGILFLYVLAHVGGWCVIAAGDHLSFIVDGVNSGIRRAMPAVMSIALVFYALSRVTRYSPLLVGRYGTWLANTPWRPGMPLPLGPSTLVWEDLAPLGTAVAIAIYASGPSAWLAPFTTFVVVYSLVNLVPFGRARQSTSFYLFGFAWPLVLLTWLNTPLAMSIVALILLATEVGIRHALRTFPGQSRQWAEEKRLDKLRTAGRWPLGPQPAEVAIPLSHGLLIPACVGWITFCVMATDDRCATWSHDMSFGLLFVILASVVIALTRWAVYCGRYFPPISIWGRVRTGRWIIPGYDVALIAPLLTLFTAIVLPLALRAIGVMPAATYPVSIAAVLTIAFNAPPTFRRWSLTGHHRIYSMNTSARQTTQQVRITANSPA
jgi:hypothetical protein